MMIWIDSREKPRAVTKIIQEFKNQDISFIVNKLPVGDYMSVDNPRLIIDRKQNLLEVCNNVCQDHKRFVAEIVRANEAGIKLVFLVEHGAGIKSLEDVNKWYNPRLKTSPLAVSGQRLFKILYSIKSKYGVEFLFCTKSETGKRIIELLGGGEDG